MFIPINRIFPNPEQPRVVFDMRALKGLAGSIREHGIIEPLVVESAGDDYILHDGERRLRAAKMAGLTEVPAVVHPPMNGSGPQSRLERALIANIQRENMHIIAEARGYARLIREFGLNVNQLSIRMGKSYQYVSNVMRRLKLAREIQDWMLAGKLPTGMDAVNALLLLDEADAITLAGRFADQRRRVTALMIKRAVHNLLLEQGRALLDDGKIGRDKSPALHVARETMRRPRAALPDWDVIAQAGQAPPWETVETLARATCDDCPLRETASMTMCGECALAQFLRRAMETAHVV